MRLTITVLKAALDNGIVNVGEDLVLLKLLPETDEAHLLPSLAAFDLVSGGCLELPDPGHLLPNALDLLSAVLLQDATGLLKALVGQLLEGNIRGSTEGSAATAGSDGRGSHAQ